MSDAVPGLFPGAPLPPTGSPVVDWITDGTRRDRTVLAAVPPLFAAYATVVIPGDVEDKDASDAALVEVLRAHTTDQPWWLGYLDTGVADVVDDSVARTAVYGMRWSYVLLQGDADSALASRSVEHTTPWHSALPELVFPLDRSWLVSTMWDDDWRCVGGSAELVDALLAEPALEVRAVDSDEEATPPGHDDV